MSTNTLPKITTQDGGAQDTSDSDDHFSSASEGASDPGRLNTNSPIPTTRVELVDDKPHHGEVPGTSAYEKRTQDAVPDEVEIVPEGTRSRSGTLSQSRTNSALDLSRPQTPGGTPIPKTVVEKVDDEPRHGEVDGTAAKEKRMADAAPDEVRITPEVAGQSIQGRSSEVNETPEERQAWFRSMWEKEEVEEHDEHTEHTEHDEHDEHIDETPTDDTSNDADESFGDDFDDFAEGGTTNDDDDFGDFDEADTTPLASEPEPKPFSPTPTLLAGLPPLDLQNSPSETLTPYLDAIFPSSEPLSPSSPSPPQPFLSPRSLSLWQQLVSPPPMAPPNWTRSRIRRLFLVSLGVPVDLDEILPPSQQKRLILPNISLSASTSSPRASSGALERLRSPGGNDSSTSVDSKSGGGKKGGRKGGAAAGKRELEVAAPEFDANAAALVCGTTEEAMGRFGDGELRGHVGELEAWNRRASAVLEFWLQRKDEGLKEKEALEGVIENLVGFVKGRRGK